MRKNKMMCTSTSEIKVTQKRMRGHCRVTMFFVFNKILVSLKFVVRYLFEVMC